jgi:drug/metabolite transporter (DMT)-like permease
MPALLAFVATILTSLLPIVSKRLLRDARPAMVAWATNAGSLPLLAVGTLLLTQCSLTFSSGREVACVARVPVVDGIFVGALLGAALLNWAATLLSTVALSQADASLVSPLLTFNPAFTLFIAIFTLGEVPGLRQTLGVVVVLLGAYLLEVKQARTGLLVPLRLLWRRPASLLAIGASVLWGTTTVLEKLAIDHMRPPSGPVVALFGTLLLVLFLTPGAFRRARRAGADRDENRWKGLLAHPRALALAALIAGMAPLFGFTAIALGLVGYVTTIFKLSAVLTILWAKLFLGEGQIRERLLGAIVMIIGGLLVAV